MRDIKFKGKRQTCDVWVNGYLDYDYDAHTHIIDGYLVNSETVGQFTGLRDKNGKEIYEGDVVKTERADYRDISVIVWDYLEFKLKSIQELPQSSLHKFEYGNLSPILKYFDLEVIGNIYDNPGLQPR